MNFYRFHCPILRLGSRLHRFSCTPEVLRMTRISGVKVRSQDTIFSTGGGKNLHSSSRFLQLEMKGEEDSPVWTRDQHGVVHYVVKTNEKFENYYRAQNTCGSQEELQLCLATMRKELPQGFRLNAGVRPSTLNQLKKILCQIRDEHEGLMRSMSWSDDQIWQLTGTSRWNLIDDEAFAQLHKFIVEQNELGHISRQEVVSMIPVLLLDVRPHHFVLDICASPGSKTKQVLSRMHELAGPLPSGLVIANEWDVTRCEKLSNNTRKVNSPCLVVMNQDGSRFPDLFLDAQKETRLTFDRIVCDVPCSGDGTIRKNPTVWEGWSPGSGNSRHFIQYNIAERAAELLKVGGLMCYSSCSINPIENEAVVGRLVKLSEGALELVDVEGELPGFKYAKGHTTWTVMDSEMTAYQSFDEVPENVKASQIHRGMFSVHYEDGSCHLDRCLRILPHHNDCGGFFVAILKKIRPLPWETAVRPESDETFMSRRLRETKRGELEKYLIRKEGKRRLVALEPRNRFVRRMWRGRNFFNFFDGDDDALRTDLRFYGFPPELQDPSIYFTTSESRKNVYLANENVKKVIECNVDSQPHVSLFQGGVKVFTKNTMANNSVGQVVVKDSRLVSLMGNSRTVEVTVDDVKLMLKAEPEHSFTFTDDNSGLSEKARERMRQVADDAVGPVKVVCKVDAEDLEFVAHLGSEKIVVRAHRSLRYHGLLVLGEETVVT